MRYLRKDTESFAQCIENMRLVQRIKTYNYTEKLWKRKII